MSNLNSVAIIALNEPLDGDPLSPDDNPPFNSGEVLEESLIIITRKVRRTNNAPRRVFYQPPSSKYESH